MQAVRNESGLQGVSDALLFLGSVGVRPDAETMEYFRIPEQLRNPAPGYACLHLVVGWGGV